MDDNTPHGFVLSESALYAYQDQDVFPDLISFCSAIPDHLRPLFLIPIQIYSSDSSLPVVASRIADGAIPSGQTEEGDWFGSRTFVYDHDIYPTIPSSDPGSIFDQLSPDNMTRHQNLEEEQDKNYQDPTDTSFMTDVDLTDSNFQYPYRTEESPVRHSSILVVNLHVALSPEALEARASKKITDNAESCNVSLISYDARGRVYTFSVSCGGKPRTVRAALTDLKHIAMNCSCPFWRWNGPEFHARTNMYLLGQTRGTASPPDVRDPDRIYWLCKHTYAVLSRFDNYVAEMVEKNEGKDEESVLEDMNENWDDLENIVEIPLDEAEKEDVDLKWEKPDPEDEEDVSKSFKGKDSSSDEEIDSSDE